MKRLSTCSRRRRSGTKPTQREALDPVGIASNKGVGDVDQQHNHGEVDARFVQDVEQFLIAFVRGSVRGRDDGVANHGKQRGHAGDDVPRRRCSVLKEQRYQSSGAEHAQENEELWPKGSDDLAEIFDVEVLEQRWGHDGGLENDDADDHTGEVKVHERSTRSSHKNTRGAPVSSGFVAFLSRTVERFVLSFRRPQHPLPQCSREQEHDRGEHHACSDGSWPPKPSVKPPVEDVVNGIERFKTVRSGVRWKVGQNMRKVSQGRQFHAWTASPKRGKDDAPEQQTVRKQPNMVRPVVQNLREVNKIRTQSKRDGSPGDVAEVRVDQDEVGDVRQHAKAHANPVTVFDVLRSAFAHRQSDDGVRDGVDEPSPLHGGRFPRPINPTSWRFAFAGAMA